MRRYLQGVLVVALGMFVASVAVAFDPPAYTPGAGIQGTVHDLGTSHNGMNYVAIPADPQQRVCIFCHAPHHSYRLSGTGIGSGPQAPDAVFDYLPLWNHELTGNYASFVMYENGQGAPQVGGKASQAIQNGMQLGSTSLLCLSCHDGSVAVNSYGNISQPATSRSGTGPTIGGGYVIGKDNYLGNHHPVGFDYVAVQSVDPEIRPADTTLLTATSTIQDHLYGLGSTRMECASCHSVHNKGNPHGETLLWRSDTNSELCLTCHDKGTYTVPAP